MKYLLPTLTLGLALALAAPVAAQPLDIIVRGGTPAVLPPVIFDGGDDYVYGWQDFRDDQNFDPAAAAINALNVMNPNFRGRAPDVDLVFALAFRSGSWARHQERCQAAFATYDWGSDTYLVGGLPRRCPL